MKNDKIYAIRYTDPDDNNEVKLCYMGSYPTDIFTFNKEKAEAKLERMLLAYPRTDYTLITYNENSQ